MTRLLTNLAANVLMPRGIEIANAIGTHEVERDKALSDLDSKAKKPTCFSNLGRITSACLCLISLGAVPRCYAQAPAPTCDAQSVFRAATADLKRQQYDQAERALDSLHSCKALSPIDRFNLGWLYGRAHNFSKALGEFNSVNATVPNRKTHQYAIALAQFELADYSAVVDSLWAVDRQDLSEESTSLLAVSYSKLGRYQNAEILLTDEIHRSPNDRLAYLNLVTLLCDEGKLADAAEVANKAVAAFPRNAEMLVVRGTAHTLVGEVVKARADFQAAIEAAPLYGPPRFFLAVSDYKEGRYAAARNEITQAIRAGIRDADLHYLLAETTLRIAPGNTDGALAELNRSIAINPRQVQALSLRGKIRLQHHDLKEAVSDLELARSIDPASASATYNLARAYFALGRTADANALSKQLAPSGPDAVNELSDQRLKSELGLQSHPQ